MCQWCRWHHHHPGTGSAGRSERSLVPAPLLSTPSAPATPGAHGRRPSTAGAAHVLGLALLVHAARLPVRLRVLLPVAENRCLPTAIAKVIRLVVVVVVVVVAFPLYCRPFYFLTTSLNSSLALFKRGGKQFSPW